MPETPKRVLTRAKYEVGILSGLIRLSVWHGGAVHYEFTLLNKPEAKLLERAKEFLTVDKAIAYATKHGCMSGDWEFEYELI